MNQELVEGMNKLKTGALINLLSVVLMLIGIITAVATFGFMPIENPRNLIGMLAIAGLFIILVIIALVLGIVGFIMYFKATGHLKRYDEKYGIGRTGMVLQIIGLLLIFIPILAILAIISQMRPYEVPGLLAISLVFIFILIGAIMIIVGAILFGIMLIRLEDVESDFKVAGIVYFVGMILSFILGAIGSIIGIVSTILIYMSANKALKKLSTS